MSDSNQPTQPVVKLTHKHQKKVLEAQQNLAKYRAEAKPINEHNQAIILQQKRTQEKLERASNGCVCARNTKVARYEARLTQLQGQIKDISKINSNIEENVKYLTRMGQVEENQPSVS